jgi:hypothetical protein
MTADLPGLRNSLESLTYEDVNKTWISAQLHPEIAIAICMGRQNLTCFPITRIDQSPDAS